MPKIAAFVKDVAVPVITVLTATGVAWLNFSVSNVEHQLKERDQERVERESLESFQLKVYEAVRTSLESAAPEQQEVAKALVTHMAQEPLRTGLLNVLKDAGTEEVKQEVAGLLQMERVFQNEQAVLEAEPRPREARPARPPGETQAAAVGGFDWEDIDYDLFWCESSGETARDQAQAIHDAMKAQGAEGRLRVRLLPDSINARPGYQHTGYVIRRNRGEEKQAEALKRLGDRLLGTDFEISLSVQPTPWYLSAFLCP